jgi:hypothetical protein
MFKLWWGILNYLIRMWTFTEEKLEAECSGKLKNMQFEPEVNGLLVSEWS